MGGGAGHWVEMALVAGVAAVPYPGDGARDRRTGLAGDAGTSPFGW
jgi:hypothetical protein